MTRVLVDLPLPDDWHVLDLDPATGRLGLDRLLSDLTVAQPALGEPAARAAARAHYARLGRAQRERGVLVSAFLLGRDEDGVLAAALEAVTVPLGPPGVHPGVAADGVAAVLARAATPGWGDTAERGHGAGRDDTAGREYVRARDVARLDLPAGPAVGLRDVLDHAGAGQTGLAQVWFPLATGDVLVLTLTTPQVAELDGFTQLLLTVASGLVLSPAPALSRSGQGPTDRHSRARSAAT